MTADQAGPRRRRRQWAASRIGKLVSLMAISWSIGGGFLLLEEGLPKLFDSIARRGWISDSLVMTRPSPASDCDAAVRRVQSFVPDPRVAAEARFLVWRVGVDTGVSAGFASANTAGTAQGIDASTLAEPRRFAEQLGLDPPAVPPFQHAATAISEFEAFVARGAGCQAAQVAAKYSPRDAALLKLGLVVGFAAVYRTKVPSLEPLFVPEVRFYGGDAGIPLELRQPFVDDTLDSLAGKSREEKMLFAIKRVADYVAAHP